MNIPDQTLKFLESEEGCRLNAYQDSRGIWTIGVGMTTLHGLPVKQGDSITQQEADNLFAITANRFYNQVKALVHVPVNDNQLTALTSFTYNEGVGALSTSALLKKLNAKNYTGAAQEFLNWTRAGFNPKILLSRRQREKALFEAKSNG